MRRFCTRYNTRGNVVSETKTMNCHFYVLTTFSDVFKVTRVSWSFGNRTLLAQWAGIDQHVTCTHCHWHNSNGTCNVPVEDFFTKVPDTWLALAHVALNHIWINNQKPNVARCVFVPSSMQTSSPWIWEGDSKMIMLKMLPGISSLPLRTNQIVSVKV